LSNIGSVCQPACKNIFRGLWEETAIFYQAGKIRSDFLPFAGASTDNLKPLLREEYIPDRMGVENHQQTELLFSWGIMRTLPIRSALTLDEDFWLPWARHTIG